MSLQGALRNQAEGFQSEKEHLLNPLPSPKRNLSSKGLASRGPGWSWASSLIVSVQKAEVVCQSQEELILLS